MPNLITGNLRQFSDWFPTISRPISNSAKYVSIDNNSVKIFFFNIDNQVKEWTHNLTRNAAVDGNLQY